MTYIEKKWFKPIVQNCVEKINSKKKNQAKYYNTGSKVSANKCKDGEWVYIQNDFKEEIENW